MNTPYMYIFTRTDMSPEQVAIQTAHATFVAGAQLEGLPADKVHFVLIGCANGKSLRKTYKFVDKVLGHKYPLYPFIEAYMGNEMTSFATGVISDPDDRAELAMFGLLKFRSK